MTARLKTALWVQAQVRLCDLNFIPVAIGHKGDPDAGSVLMKLLRKDGLCLLLRRITTLDGAPGWMAAAGEGEVNEATADSYIDREIGRDRDLWVIEIEDYDGRYVIDGSIEA